MSSVVSYVDIIEVMTSIAERHYQVNSFFLGRDYELENNGDLVYPVFQVYPEFARMPINDYKQYKTLEVTLNCKVIDLTTNSDSNIKDVHSDTLRIAQDIVNELNAHPFYVRSNVSLMEDISFEALEHFDDDVTAGWKFSLKLKVINANTFCGMPIEQLPGYSANGPTSSGNYVTVDWRGPTGPQGPTGPAGIDGATGSSVTPTLSQVLTVGATAGTNISMTTNTANTLVYHDASKNLKSVTLGSGLTLTGGTLSVINKFSYTDASNGITSVSNSNTLSKSVLIPANTLTNGSLNIKGRSHKSGTGSYAWLIIYVNTTNSLSGASEIGRINNGSNNTVLRFSIDRTIPIKVGSFFSLIINAITGYEETITNNVSTVTIDWTVDQYIILAVQANGGASPSESLVANFLSVNQF